MTRAEGERLAKVEERLDHQGRTLDKISKDLESLSKAMERNAGAADERQQWHRRRVALLAAACSFLGGSVAVILSTVLTHWMH